MYHTKHHYNTAYVHIYPIKRPFKSYIHICMPLNILIHPIHKPTPNLTPY